MSRAPRWLARTGPTACHPPRSERCDRGPWGDGRLPSPDPTAGWTLTLSSDGARTTTRRHDSLTTLSSGDLGVRGDHEGGDDPGRLVLVAGAFGTSTDGLVRPLPGPGWTDLGPHGPPAGGRRLLDMRDGTLWREAPEEGLRSFRFVSLAHPGIAVLRAEDDRRGESWPAALEAPAPSPLAAEQTFHAGPDGEGRWAETVGDRATITASARQWSRTTPDHRRVERLAAFRAGEGSQPDRAAELLSTACATGFDELLREHRRAWARRWAGADIEIVGDPAAQLAARFALFHLLSCAPTHGEATVGARGLTGLAYAGHVFWDTDVFVLPALAAILPDAARAVVEYRIRRLPAARARAEGRGRRGALFPWESADTGADVTPGSMRDSEGNRVPVLHGDQAMHINADVAWSALHYIQWTGDAALMDAGGGRLVLETARHWADLIRRDDQGRGHIDDVIGPDEYHERVDDNAYTNNMARWHLRQAATLARQAGDPEEASTFEDLAASLIDGFDPVTGRHEEFAGFDALEPMLIAEIAEPPIAADLLLGRARLAHTQVVKQPDVLMLHHLLPTDVPPGSRTADLDHYLPRTAHGSSLSPAICASLLARSGRPDEAMALFDLAARMDLDDLTGTTAAGLHVATMGGLWQAIVHGFAGIRPTADRLEIDPHLPSRWEALHLRVHFRGQRVAITIEPRLITVDAADPVPLVIEGEPTWGPVQIARTEGSRRP